MIENIQREDLNPIEEAQAYKRLLEEFNLKQDEVAERVSKSRTAVTNSMRLLKLCDEVQQMVVNEMISTGHARALLSIEDPEEQYMIAQKVFDEKMSVQMCIRDSCKIVRNAYAIEYDCINARQLYPTLEFKNIEGLFSGGQFNGSSGYEEAAAQGLIAGMNAALSIQGKEQIILDRSPVSYTHLDVYKRQE